MKSFVDFIRNNVGHVLSWSSERVPGRGSDTQLQCEQDQADGAQWQMVRLGRLSSIRRDKFVCAGWMLNGCPSSSLYVDVTCRHNHTARAPSVWLETDKWLSCSHSALSLYFQPSSVSQISNKCHPLFVSLSEVFSSQVLRIMKRRKYIYVYCLLWWHLVWPCNLL